jgi:prepilin-type N-terminal cleavage/methylation domain-containing protein/prepilin-type processing-associated H-X9-DG protein
MKRRAFTLIELAIVTAIIAILTALLLPAISRSKELGRSAVCLNNLHQIGIGLQIYVQDNQNVLPVMYDRPLSNTPPAGPAINQVLLSYVNGVSNIFRCPSDNHQLFELTGSSYAWNSLLNGQDADHLQMLTNAYLMYQIFVVFDKEKFHFARGDRRAINYLYADGHIRNLMELQTVQ